MIDDSAASLGRLNDIVLPPDIPWWPLAPGWYGLLLLLIAACLWLLWKRWRSWRADAYRRAALRALAAQQDAAAVAELLRRTALAFTPRETVAGMAGETWADWLAAKCELTMPLEVRQTLVSGVYRGGVDEHRLEALRTYGAGWILHHRACDHV